MIELNNSDIRRIILDEHDTLRGQINEIVPGLDALEKGDRAAIGRLNPQLARFCDYLVKHIEHEEHILAPVLKHLDAWGPVRIQRMDEDHKMQRSRISRVRGLHNGTDVHEYLREVRDFISGLELEMLEEEADCLNENVLRDDLIVIDSFGG